MGTDELIIRPAGTGDVAAGAAVFIEAEGALAATRRARPRWPSDAVRDAERAAAEEDIEALRQHPSDLALVAVRDGVVVGLGGVIVREAHAHITYLFVHPAAQNQGVGRTLLNALAAHGAACRVRSLHVSPDPRALTRYLTLGLQPMPPTIHMSSNAPRFPSLDPDDHLAPVPLRADDTATLATVSDIDRAVRGVRRVDDLRAWLDGGASGELLFQRGTSVPAGYFLIEPNNRQTGIGVPASIGPVAAMDTDRFPAILRRALHAAGSSPAANGTWRVDLPAENHLAVAPLLAAGFRPDRLNPYLATGTIGAWDRYIFHDHDLL